MVPTHVCRSLYSNNIEQLSIRINKVYSKSLEINDICITKSDQFTEEVNLSADISIIFQLIICASLMSTAKISDLTPSLCILCVTVHSVMKYIAIECDVFILASYRM